MTLINRSVMIMLTVFGAFAVASADPKDSGKSEMESGEVDISGYIQTQYEMHEDSRNATIDDQGNLVKGNKDNIYIRRGRLKVEYQATKTSKFRIYFDGSKDKLSLLEAWIELKRKFGSVGTKLRAGQQNIPFGFEIEYSSSKRDFPERSTMERMLFAGERERLVNVTVAPVPQLEFNVAVLNGPGIKDKEFTYESPFEDSKDFVGRVRTTHKTGRMKFSGGVSGYLGKQFDDGDTADFKTDKNRYGADAQLEFTAFPKLGKSAVRGEVMIGEEFGLRKMGFYVWLTQQLGEHFGAAARYDMFDPNTRIEDGSKLTQVSLAGHYYFDTHVRCTVSYDIRKDEEVGNNTDKADNILNLVLQYAI
ncbi:MAG: hypothetical protein Kow0074_11270 [Candidatus Zixiibacteriota bacterium]